MATILHADFDAFYASVEQRDNPVLRGKPVVVGGDPNARGVVAAASYEVRRFGVRSAMPMKTAMRMCPQAFRVTPRFDVYREVSQQVMDIFRVVTPLVEPISLDEAFLDVTNRIGREWTPERIARGLKGRVKRRTRLSISVGAASSKSVAKIASDMGKPDGLIVIEPGTEREFLAPLPVGRLWGIGPKTQQRLADDGITTIEHLSNQSVDWFTSRFGKMGPFLRELAHGVDNRSVIVGRRRKSLSAETTLPVDSGDIDHLGKIVGALSLRVSRQLEKRELIGRTVKLKLRLDDFTTFTRQITLSTPTSSSEDIRGLVLDMLRRELFPGRRFRLIGVGVSGFDAPVEFPRQPRLAGLS